MASTKPIVFVVDDDVSVRESLELLIYNEGWQPETFASAQEFLDRSASPGSELSAARYFPSWPEWSGPTEARRRRTDQHADNTYHRLRRCTKDGSGDEGRCCRIPNETIQ